MKLLLGNPDYPAHMTNEGDQFQRGLESAGWHVVYGPAHVPDLLDEHQPSHVFVHDKRDWDPASPISFRKDIGYTGLEALREFDGPVFTILKDAGSMREYQRAFVEEIDADRVVVFHCHESLDPFLGWLPREKRVRSYLSIDSTEVPPWRVERERGIVSGAVGGDIYATRKMAMANANALGIDVHRHPGYGNKGSATRRYLYLLSHYRVSVATSSSYGFALRKIIESVAAGCAVVTDLPACDRLPFIDGALYRVPHGCSVDVLRDAIDRAEREWIEDERRAWSGCARIGYDYHMLGMYLDADLCDTVPV